MIILLSQKILRGFFYNDLNANKIKVKYLQNDFHAITYIL